MAYVIADPEIMASAASDLTTIESNVNAAHMVAAARTTSVIPAAADEVSTSIAHLFSQHAATYQALAGQAAAFNDQFVQQLTAGAFSYASAEATNASLLVLPNFPATIAGLFQDLLDFPATIAGVLQNLPAELLPFVAILVFVGFILLIEFAIFIYALPQVLPFVPQLLLADIPPLFGI
ncbi:PE family protein [Mycobacterium paraense]|uniref:PE family protein n=1 Tax=Mycobacterium paraense TaxID=767916 RepID=UPI000A166059|nr:PE family protein [Mycobacterium paraense]